MFDLDIAKRIKDLRELKELSIYDMTVRTGLSHSCILKIENGQRQPNLNTLTKLCEGMDVTIGEFFADESTAVLNDQERTVVKAMKKLTKKQRDAVVKLLNSMTEE